MMQYGTAFPKAMFVCLPKEPHQAANLSITLIGKTHWSPNMQNTIVHNEEEDDPDSSHLLHMQHHSNTILPLFRRLSVDKIFPRAAVQENKAKPQRGLLNAAPTSKETKCHQMKVRKDNNLTPQDPYSQQASGKVYPTLSLGLVQRIEHPNGVPHLRDVNPSY